MLHEKILYPNWRTVEEWLQSGPKQLDIIRDLARQGKICQVSAAGEFRFQHDRFLEYFSIKALGLLLPHPNDHQDVLAEPYYAELIGRALVKYPQPDAVLDRIRWLHPLALAFSIGEIGEPATDYHRTLIRKVQEWIQYAGRNSSTPESVRGAVANCFINTDSPAVLDIVNTDFGLEVPWFGLMARLRNGDTESGVKLFELVGTDYRKDSYVTELVEHAKRYHGARLHADLVQDLAAVTDERHFKGATILASYLALPDLAEALVASWQRQAQRTRHLDTVICAVLRSSEHRHEDPSLTTLMDYWEAMPDTPEESKASKQRDTAQGIRQLLSAEIDQEVVTYLVDQANHRPGLRSAIAHICGRIDLPDAIEFATREDAQLEEWQQYSSLTHWSSFDNPRLSPGSITRLQQLWSDGKNQEAVRQVAFSVWLRNVDRDTVNVLALIQPTPSGSPLYIRALIERALLGDMTCVPDLLEKLEAYPGLYRVLPPVWNESLKQAVAARLQSFAATIPSDFSGGVLDEHYLLAPVLTDIPVPDAEALLTEFWGHLRYSRLFLQAAVFVGTPTTLALVDEVINDYPTDVDPFQYLDTIYGFYDRSRRKRLTLEHLKHLEPYIERMKYEEKFPCGEFCYQQGGDYLVWCKTHLLLDVNDACRNRYCPTEEDILQQLSGPTTHLRNHALHLLDQFRKRNDPSRFLDILRRWLQDSPNWQKVEAAAHCIEEIGSRDDVTILDVSLEYDWEIHQAKVVKESARFAICRRSLS